MTLGTRSLVGRQRELDAITQALHEALSGHGSLWLMTGEPGIGKSRLTEEVARIAAERDVQVLWGRCWEAGGAPAYWPFIQVLRGLLRGRGADSVRTLITSCGPGCGPNCAPDLCELLPELRELAAQAAPLPPLPPEEARFRLMDAVARVLCDAAAETPAVLLLEDLHASDPSSVLLLDFLSRQLAAARLLVIGTYREADAQRSAVGAPLAKLAAHTHVLPLQRLDRGEVRVLLERMHGAPMREATQTAIFDATEGNPLFVSEVARLQARLGGAKGALGASVPTSIKTAIRERMQTLSERARTLLGVASVVGRECRAASLVELSERAPTEVADALDECAAAEVLIELSPGHLRFSHILLQQVAYADLDDPRRQSLHARVAALLERDAIEPTGSELAHHLLCAGPPASRRAVDAARRAAKGALEQHAFAEAGDFYARALGALAHTEHTQEERCELLLEVGHAKLTAHETEAGLAACDGAVGIARALGDARLFARAALARGAVFDLGVVSERLVALLQEALAMLGPKDDALCACVMARLSAAMQPAVDPEPPIALARDAIAMARRLGDEPTLLAAIRAGCAALMDLSDSRESQVLNHEHVVLAQKLGDRPEAFRGYLRLAMSSYELGKLDDAITAVEACQRLSRELGQPHYGWRAAALGAARAIWQGRFQEAEELQGLASELGERAADPNAQRSLLFQRFTRLRIQGCFDQLAAEVAKFEAGFPDHPMVRTMIGISVAAALERAGRLEAARAKIGPHTHGLELALHDHTMFDAATNAFVALGDRSSLERLYANGLQRATQLVSGGVFGLTWEQPVQRGLARLASALGQWDDAEQHYAAAVAILRKHGARSLLAWTLWEYGSALHERGAEDRAAALLDEAAGLGRELGITPLAERPSNRGPVAVPEGDSVDAPLTVPRATLRPPDARSFRLQREGEYWSIERGGRSFRLKHGKGIAMLARLIEEPGRELHVLDLASPDGTIDRGDAGSSIDAAARSAYQARVRELREELEQAEAWSDRGRGERAQAELDAIAEALSSALGLGGRARRSNSATERARVNVQRRLRDALQRIAEHDPDLGRYLDWAVRTGTFCSFREG